MLPGAGLAPCTYVVSAGAVTDEEYKPVDPLESRGTPHARVRTRGLPAGCCCCCGSIDGPPPTTSRRIDRRHRTVQNGWPGGGPYRHTTSRRRCQLTHAHGAPHRPVPPLSAGGDHHRPPRPPAGPPLRRRRPMRPPTQPCCCT
jgi:hypothetical protein